MTTLERVKQEIQDWSGPEGMSPSVLLYLSEPLRSLLQSALRNGAITSAELELGLGLGTDEGDEVARLLVACGFLKRPEPRRGGAVVYYPRYARSRRSRVPDSLWGRLAEPEEGQKGPGGGGERPLGHTSKKTKR